MSTSKKIFIILILRVVSRNYSSAYEPTLVVVFLLEHVRVQDRESRFFFRVPVNRARDRESRFKKKNKKNRYIRSFIWPKFRIFRAKFCYGDRSPPRTIIFVFRSQKSCFFKFLMNFSLDKSLFWMKIWHKDGEKN